MTLETVTCEGVPDLFARAVASLRAARHGHRVDTDEISPPRGVAPWTYALSAATGPPEATVDGRLILLHDPAGQPGWRTTFRMVSYVSAQTSCPPKASAVWRGWETSLASARAVTSDPAGTVTHVSSQRFGALRHDDEPPRGYKVELRVSWTPGGAMGSHLVGWCDYLASLAEAAVTAHNM